jgi:hypothetical protein
LDLVIETNHPTLAPKARYIMGQAAEELADEMALIGSRSGETSIRLRQRQVDNVERLRALAKRFYAQNASLSRVSRVENEWITKSKRRMSLNGAIEKVEMREDFVPAVSNYDLPFEWSL